MHVGFAALPRMGVNGVALSRDHVRRHPLQAAEAEAGVDGDRSPLVDPST